jgi:hypothetical protein
MVTDNGRVKLKETVLISETPLLVTVMSRRKTPIEFEVQSRSTETPSVSRVLEIGDRQESPTAGRRVYDAGEL